MEIFWCSWLLREWCIFKAVRLRGCWSSFARNCSFLFLPLSYIPTRPYLLLFLIAAPHFQMIQGSGTIAIEMKPSKLPAQPIPRFVNICTVKSGKTPPIMFLRIPFVAIPLAPKNDAYASTRYRTILMKMAVDFVVIGIAAITGLAQLIDGFALHPNQKSPNGIKKHPIMAP